jgi:hypothetical protein
LDDHQDLRPWTITRIFDPGRSPGSSTLEHRQDLRLIRREALSWVLSRLPVGR